MKESLLGNFGKRGFSKVYWAEKITLDRKTRLRYLSKLRTPQKSIKFPHTCTIFHTLFMFDNCRNHLTCLKMGLDIWHFVSTIFWKKPMFWKYPQSWFSEDFCPSKTIFQAPTHWTLIYLAILYWLFKFTLPETHRKSQHLENRPKNHRKSGDSELLETVHFLRANLLLVLGDI